ncbi:MAG: hypothetical protein Q4B75_07785 [Eubacteriales bacterium]|nr:hypothetical protein [Eubacteriales bacterium]
MSKVIRVFVMAVSLIVMFAVMILFGFVETDVPTILYFMIWMACAGTCYFSLIGSVDKKDCAIA